MIFGFIENKILGGFFSLKLKYASSGSLVKKLFSFIHSSYQYETGCYLPFNIEVKGPINFPMELSVFLYPVTLRSDITVLYFSMLQLDQMHWLIQIDLVHQILEIIA
jgi:hypothetical protein